MGIYLYAKLNETGQMLAKAKLVKFVTGPNKNVSFTTCVDGVGLWPLDESCECVIVGQVTLEVRHALLDEGIVDPEQEEVSGWFPAEVVPKPEHWHRWLELVGARPLQPYIAMLYQA